MLTSGLRLRVAPCLFLPLLGCLLGLAVAYGEPLQSFGSKIGGSWTNQSLQLQSGAHLDNTDAHQGWAIGGFAEWTLPKTERLTLLTEGILIEKGFHSRVRSYTSYHLAFPLLAKFALLTGETQPYVLGGPSFEFPFDDDEVLDAYQGDSFVLSWQVGAGLRWKALLTELRYARDDTQHLDDSYRSLESRSSWGWLLLAGCQLTLPHGLGD